MASNTQHLIGKTIDGTNFTIGQFLDAGSFGCLHKGRNHLTGEEVAIKMESYNIRAKQLPLEHEFYKILGIGKGVPRIYAYGRCQDFNCLVMELLGESLEERFTSCGRIFSANTSSKVAIQILDLIEFLHNRRLIHRDIKPDNFLFGLKNGPKVDLIHLIDFGLAKVYRSEDGALFAFRPGKGIGVGTHRYMSINGHKGEEMSRRDDLQAIGYMLIYFMKGSLPWQGLNISDAKLRSRRICDIKEGTSIEVLCKGCKNEISLYMKEVLKMYFHQTPNYKYLKDLFYKIINESGGFEKPFDWNLPHESVPQPNPSLSNVRSGKN